MNDIDANLLSEAAQKAHNAIAILSPKGKFEWVNKAFSRITGYSLEEVAGKEGSEVFEHFLIEEAMAMATEEDEAQDSPEAAHQEIYCNRKDGSSFRTKISFSPMLDDMGDIAHFVAVCTEITEKKELLEKLSTRLKENEKILASLKEGYILVDEHANIHDVNQAYCDIVGYSREELLSMKLTELRPGMTQEYQREFIESVIERGGRKFETEHKTKDGEMVELEATASAIKRDDTIFLAGFVWDITERKKAQRKLRESEERWQRLVGSNPLCVIISIDGKIEYVNQAGLKLYEAENVDELIGKSILEFVHEEHKEKVEERIKKIRNGGTINLSEQKLVTLKGTIKEIEAHSVPIVYRGQNAAQTVLKDITESKKAERRLRESEERWQRLVDFNPETVLVIVDGKIKYINKAGVELAGAASKDDILGKPVFSFAAPIYQKLAKDRIKKLSQKKSIAPVEYELVTMDGQQKVVRAHSVNIKFRGKDAIQAVLTDITDFKKRERQLKDSQQRFKSLFDRNPNAVFSFDLEGNFKQANQELEKLIGYSVEELKEMNFKPLTCDEHKERVWNHFKKAAEGNPQRYEATGIHKSGDKVHFFVTNLPIYVNDEIVGVFGIAQDITEQKEMAEELKKSEQKWQHLIEGNPQPLQVTVDGKIVFINEAGAKLYGADNPEEIIGMSVFAFSHPDHVAEIEKRKEKLENDLNVDDVHEHKIVLLSGETRHVEVSSIPIKYQGSDAIQTVLYDITDRKKKESIIEASLVEKEVLLKEIHHRVKNNMAVISGLLELQAMNTQDTGLQDLLKESQLRIFSMAMIHEKLYQTETFSDIDFAEYVKELVKTITDTIDVSEKDIGMTYKLNAIRLNINQAIPAALIINEAVVNSFKHAFEGRDKGVITISMNQEGNDIKLKIEDDGKGLPENFEIERQQSLGTTLIQTLTEQLGGTLSLAAASKGSGTCVEICFTKDS